MSMERPLLFSEQALICALSNTPIESGNKDLRIVEEHFSLPRTQKLQWFNTDFYLNFVAPIPPKGKRHVEAVPIRRRSIGSELFFVTGEYGNPVSIELLNGEALPKAAFSEELSIVEKVVKQARMPEWTEGVVSAPFLRVLDLEQGIIFLASTTSEIAKMAGLPSSQHLTDSHHLHVRKLVDETILIEGVVFRRWPRQS